MYRKFKLIFFVLFLSIISSTGFSQNQKRALTDSSRFNSPHSTSLQAFFSKSNFSESSRSIQAARKRNDLRLFGIDLFNKNGSELGAEQKEGLVLPPKYKLGPGDRIGVFLLGNVQENREVTVNVEGKIFLPPAGVIFVWGLNIEEFKKLLSKKLSRYYDNFNLDIMLLQPKNIMVAVVGEVFVPGKYVLSSMNTVLDAVILAGGPTAKGSLRDIQLIRDGEVSSSVDLYQFLMNGNNDFDEFLEAGDRIFVPLARKIVTVEGEVNRESIFELKPGLSEKLTDLIDLAGGFTEYAFEDKIEISRLEEDGRRKLQYVNYREIVAGDSTQNLLLKNEDEIKVYSKLDQIHDRKISIFGEIRNPGEYDLENNMRLSDLILKAGSLTRKAYTIEAEVAKIDPGQPTKFLKINLQNLSNGTNGHSDILLEEDDQVFIRQIPQWEVGLTVELRGEIMFPGKYSIVRDRTHLSEILGKAGWFTDVAFLQEAMLIRPKNRLKFDKEFERLTEMRREEMSDLEYQYFVMRQNTSDINEIVVDFEKLFANRDKDEDVILENGDIIVVPKAPRVVTITGRVAKPGGVTFNPSAKLEYYLAKSGGASWDADVRKTKIIKVSGEVLDDEDVKSFQPGDIIWVPRKSDRKFWPVFLQVVTVTAQLAAIYLIIDTSINR
ncbi:MAG: hypothetical protein E2O76_12360 [Caldithrix sp.]|nr:MAG: hypothetical protein E2O76_12360 [Caldithrix sp.]